MIDLFHIIDGGQVILRTGGVFYQAQVYRRGVRLYAKRGAGFIRLGSGDATSCPKVSWEGLDLPGDVIVSKDSLGNLII